MLGRTYTLSLFLSERQSQRKEGFITLTPGGVRQQGDPLEPHDDQTQRPEVKHYFGFCIFFFISNSI
jgi:hypothetical protein